MKTIKLTEAQFKMLSEAWIAYAGNFTDVEISRFGGGKRNIKTWKAINKQLILPWEEDDA